jgi:hypothetical protein
LRRKPLKLGGLRNASKKRRWEVSEAEYSYLASLLRKARKDTREEEADQGQALALAEEIVLLRKESRRVETTESG